MLSNHSVLILMNVQAVLINAIVMQHVTTEKALMIANVMMVMLVMVEPAVILIRCLSKRAI